MTNQRKHCGSSRFQKAVPKQEHTCELCCDGCIEDAINEARDLLRLAFNTELKDNLPKV